MEYKVYGKKEKLKELGKAGGWKRGRCDGKNLSFILQNPLVLENYQFCHYMTSAVGSWDEGVGVRVFTVYSKVYVTL